MKRILGLALGSVLCLSLAGASALAADSAYTVGDFAVKMASALKLGSPEGGFNAETATVALKGAGVVLKGNLKGELKEADVVEALSQLGLNLTTSSPDRPVTQQRADQVLRAFDGLLSTEDFSTHCIGGSNDGAVCTSDADCPGGVCGGGKGSSDKGNNPPGGGFGRGGKKSASPTDPPK